MAFKMKYSNGGFPYQSPLKDHEEGHKEKDDTIVDNAVDKIATKATIKSGSKVATNIAPKVGHKVAAKILSKIGGKFIPGVGTALIAKDIYDFSKAASKATVKELNENAASSSIYFGGRKI
tara:strand:- start:651 stop:1013 length:363 start_codon:yes stop_codon:yes gene_type:complete